ncbi:MarR family winged helix-turn-helix transcriptional regulator [Trinickia dinghuensis]|uniref:MarR family transcriptional regulator n=1 Tax=Trinickia dinghuensis TaxID=2291023 RepID=A0A3D8K4B2_9BURK|nr:MarR family winged helix-turn-helix transcriptional regulator [Trinickia dinghuensis]RDV00308.1 MarR family transcriptional regulator [Trinickia dinghuensis]
MENNSKVVKAARIAERDAASRPADDDVFDRIVRQGPLTDMWRLTLWGNFYCEPIFAELAENFDVTRDEFNVLYSLASCGSLLAKNVCEVTGRPKNSISRAVNSLVERKMIKRKTNAYDRRESPLVLNESGLRLYERVLPVAVARQTLMLKALNDKDRRELDRILEKLMSAKHEW